ncbi:unnamed protein product, partial [Effrenium voratum]
ELVVCTDGLPTEVGVDVSDCAGQVVSGQRCVVRCATNFFGTAEDYICNPFTARFEGAPMVCSRQSCGSLVSVPGRTDVNTSACKDVVVGDFCLVSCKEGYVPADASYQCVSDLSYQGTAPTCTRMPCNTATLPASAGLDVSSCYNLFVGDTCTASCLPGYLGTAAQMQCELSTDFTGTAPNCILKDCLVPPFWKQEPSFNTTCDGAKHGSTCIASCQLGYSGQSQQFACDNGQLRGQIPSCAGLPCSFQGFQLGTGEVVSDCYGKTTGESCQIVCSRGYELAGDGTATCLADGSFSRPSSVCNPTICGRLDTVAPFSPVGVDDSCDTLQFGELCTAFCSLGWDIVGNATVLLCDDAPNTSAGYTEVVPNTAISSPAVQSAGPTCDPRPCTAGIPNLLGATSDCAGKVTLETCSVVPLLGYALEPGASNNMLCQPDGSFNQSAPSIVTATCPTPSFGTGIGSTCVNKPVGSDCWAYCVSNWIGRPKRYECIADNATQTIVLQNVAAEIACSYNGTTTTTTAGARRLATFDSCSDGSVTSVGLADQQYFQDCSGKVHDEVCIAHCSFGWNMSEEEPAIFVCNSGSIEGSPLPTCTPLPCDFSFPDGLGVTHDCAGIRTAETCTASCNVTGYTYVAGNAAEVFTCQPGGSMSGTSPSCQRVSCADLSVGSIFSHNCQNKRYQDTCGVSCATGYDGWGSQFVCQADGTFQGSLPACTGNPCTNDLPENGTSWTAVGCDTLTTGETCTVSCKAGFGPISTQLSCGASGRLLGTLPLCQPVTCTVPSELGAVELAHTCQDVSYGSGCTAFCAPGTSSPQFAAQTGWRTAPSRTGPAR